MYQGVSFRVRPGEVVALVGPSGGGKSSCVNLLEHFYETKAGQVKLDGVNIQEYDHSYLHKKVHYPLTSTPVITVVLYWLVSQNI